MKPADDVPMASDKGWAWVVLAAAFTNAMLLAGYMKGIGVFFVEWQDDFGANAKDVGWVGVIIGFFTSVGALLAGALATRLSCKKIIISSGLLFAGSIAAGSFTSDIWHLYITNCVAGISLGLCLQPGWTSIGYNFQRWLGLANGVSSAGVGMGIVVLPPLLQVVCNRIGWRGSLQVTGALMVTCSVCGLLVRPTAKELYLIKKRESTKKVQADERRQRRSVTLETGVVVYRQTPFEKLVSGPVHYVTDNLGLKLLVENPRFLVICIANSLVGYSYYSGLVFFQSKVVYDNEIPKLQASYLTSAIGIGSIIGRVSSGFVVDFNVLSPRFLYGIANLFCSLFSFANPFVDTYPMLIAIAVWFGMFSGLSYSMAVYCSRLCVPADKVSSSIGVVLLSEGVGVLFGVFFMGLVRDMTSNYDMSFIMCGSSFVLASIVVFCDSLYLEILERRARQTKQDVDDKDHVMTVHPEDGASGKDEKAEEGKNNPAYRGEDDELKQCVISIVSTTDAVLPPNKDRR